MTAIVILGAANWATGPSPALRRRTLHAAALFHAGEGTHVVACGGLVKHAPTEAKAMRQQLLEAGVPDGAILLEARSTTTSENLNFVLPILDRLGTRSIVLVTDWYHLPRARLVARRLGLDVKGSSPGLHRTNVAQQTRSALREIPAYIAYYLRLRG